MTRGIRRASGFITILASLATSAGVALAQHANAVPSPGAADRKIYTNKTKFHLPVRIEDRVRAGLREINLYVKHGQAEWVKQETAGPLQKDFTYNPTQEGEYWFSIVMIDRNGKATPSDVTQVPPALKVVVDTRPPALDLQPWTAPDGEFCVRCVVQDANPDYTTLKLICKGTDQAERPLQPKSGFTGVYKVPGGGDGWSAPIRVTMSDRCGNTTSRDIQITTPTPTPPAPKQPVPPPLPVILKAEQLPPVQENKTPAQGAKAPEPPPLPPPIPPVTSVPSPTPQVLPVDHSAPAVPSMPPIVQPESKPTAVPPPVPAPTAMAAEPGRQILSTNACTMDYRIDQVGPSGVGKVEVYITTDQGNTWRRLCEDADRRSPVEMELPGEGLYGVRLVITNGNGFGGTPPARGETPTAWVEVDATNPLVQIRDMDSMLGKDGALEIRWMASDRNLRPECVNLYYATNRTGPWQNIARGLKNDGLYRWSFPREVSAPIFVRVEVADQAGNVARADSAQPIALDTTEPRGTVLGINPVNGRATAVSQQN